MKYRRSSIAIVGISIVAVALLVVVLFLRNDSASAPAPQAEKVDRFASVQPVRTNKVVIQNYTFSPTVITIEKGTSVIWTNLDITSHSIIGDSTAANIQSGALSEGGTFSYSFDEPGEYIYHCGEHSNTFGKIIVTN